MQFWESSIPVVFRNILSIYPDAVFWFLLCGPALQPEPSGSDLKTQVLSAKSKAGSRPQSHLGFSVAQLSVCSAPQPRRRCLFSESAL